MTTNLDAAALVEGRLRKFRPDARARLRSDPRAFELAIMRCRHGEVAAFAVVYDELVDVVWRVIDLSRAATQDPEELAVAVFVEIWRRAPGYDEATCSPRRWATRVALDVVGRAHRVEGGDVDVDAGAQRSS